MFYRSVITPKNILVCQNDAIGDVILSFPLCTILKQHFPQSKVYFLGKSYTKPAIDLCEAVDCYVAYEKIKDLPTPDLKAYFKELDINVALLLRNDRPLMRLIKDGQIRYRIGTSHYLPHVLNCNRLVFFSRGKIDLHQGQSRIKYLELLGIKEVPSITAFIKLYGKLNIEPLSFTFSKLLSPTKFNLILHPFTSGNSPAWKVDNFLKLIQSLETSKYKIFISGSEKENSIIQTWNCWNEDVINIAGLMPLSQFISFVCQSDGLVSGGTGPVHIAAATGIHVLGLYPTLPTNKAAEKWAPIGKKAQYLSGNGLTLDAISVEQVNDVINSWEK